MLRQWRRLVCEARILRQGYLHQDLRRRRCDQEGLDRRLLRRNQRFHMHWLFLRELLQSVRLGEYKHPTTSLFLLTFTVWIHHWSLRHGLQQDLRNLHLSKQPPAHPLSALVSSLYIPSKSPGRLEDICTKRLGNMVLRRHEKNLHKASIHIPRSLVPFSCSFKLRGLEDETLIAWEGTFSSVYN